MTVGFIAWGQYSGFKDAIACAQDRSGCPVWVISDSSPPAKVEHHPMSQFKDSLRILRQMTDLSGKWEALSIARWFVLREHGRNHPELFPVFCSDWDVLIFRSLLESYAPFLEFDYTISIHQGSMSAAYGINRFEPLDHLCSVIEELISSHKGAPRQDMEAWRILYNEGGWKYGDLFQIVRGSVFDHNMHAGADRFVMDHPIKRVTFAGGNPYFTALDGSSVRANTMHCWGSCKHRTSEFRRLAGIPSL